MFYQLDDEMFHLTKRNIEKPHGTISIYIPVA